MKSRRDPDLPGSGGGGATKTLVSAPPPNLPMPDAAAAAGSAESSSSTYVPITEAGRLRHLELLQNQLRKAIVEHANYAERIAQSIEASGDSVKNLPENTHLPFVRAVRQLAKLSIIIELCEEDPGLLMGEFMLWREDYKDMDAQDMLDAACTIWDREQFETWPSLAATLWSMAQNSKLLRPDRHDSSSSNDSRGSME